jgi:hypothetical protein
MPDAVMCWEHQGEHTWVMKLVQGGAEWIEVKRSGSGAEPSWRIDACLSGAHRKVGDAFATKEAAQGCALLLAMRQLPTHRAALHAQLDAVPGAWWWKITPPLDDASAEQRCIFSSRVMDSAEAAERSGRAAGAGWWLYVYGPGCVRALGQLPR